jgi:hypothetical protein
MNNPVDQPSQRPLPELLRFVLEHLRNLRLKGPEGLLNEEYARVWHWSCSAGNSLADKVEDLRADGYERWESGDEASIELFGENGIPQAKVFTRRAIHDLTRLGRSWRVRSASGNIDIKRFDSKEVPRLVELQATIEDVRKEDIKE